MTGIPLTSSTAEIRQVGVWLNNFRFLFVPSASGESLLLEYLIKRTFGFGKFQDFLHFSQISGMTLGIGLPGLVEFHERSVKRWRTHLSQSNLVVIKYRHNWPDLYTVNAPGMLEHLLKLWDAKPLLIKNWESEAHPLIKNVLSDMNSLNLKFPRVTFRRDMVKKLANVYDDVNNKRKVSNRKKLAKTSEKVDSPSFYEKKKRNLRGQHALDYFRTYCEDHDIPYTESVTGKLVGEATHFVEECDNNGRTVSEYIAMICEKYSTYRTLLVSAQGKPIALSGVLSFDTYFKHRRAIDAWIIEDRQNSYNYGDQWEVVD